jgi:hypothetical protein
MATVMDPTDAWDIWVAEKFGKSIVLSSIESWKQYGDGRVPQHFLEADINDPKFLFEEGTSFLSGRQYEDGFGPWGDLGSYVCVTEQPSRIVTPAQLEEYFQGKKSYAIDWFAQGQPDGPRSPGTVWVVRLWDAMKDCEVPNSRIVSDKLSWAMSVVALLID